MVGNIIICNRHNNLTDPMMIAYEASQGCTPLTIVLLLTCVHWLAVRVATKTERVIIFISDTDLGREKRRN
jgi:hypothetical protein